MIPDIARQELAALAFGLSEREYCDKIWLARTLENPVAKRPKSHSWPQSNRARGKYSPFVIPKPISTVTPFKRRKP